MTAVFLLAIVITICLRGFNPRLTDFRSFYTASEIVRHGAAHKIYDVGVQHEFQLRFFGRTGLIFDYPAAAALLYLPGAWLTVSAAYLLWTVISALMLLTSSILLNSCLKLFKHAAAMFAVTLIFVPVWINFMQGSAIFCVLLAYSLGLYYMMERREVAAGAALALGLVKFHLVLPFMLVLLIRKRWRAVGGFAAGATAFLAMCIAVAGWHFLLDYPRFLLRLSSLPLAGIYVSGMATLRGLYVGFLHREPHLMLTALTAICLLIWSARMWGNQARGFAVTIVITCLVSYHFNPHDLSLLIIPIAIALKMGDTRSRFLVFFAFAPLVPLLLLGPWFWLMGLCVIVLLIALITPGLNSDGFKQLPAMLVQRDQVNC